MKINIIKASIILLAAALIAAVVSFFFKFSLIIVPTVIICLGFVLVIFQNPLLGIFIITFLLPFERIGSFDIIGITIRPSQIFALITIISWLAFIFTKKDKKQKPIISFNKNPTIIPIFFFLGFSILSIINSENLMRSFSVFLFNSFVIIVSLIIPTLIKDEKTLTKIIYILFFSAGIVSIFGIYQFLGDMIGLSNSITGLREQYTKQVFGFPRVQSTALEPLYFANYLLIPIALAFSFLLPKNIKEKPQKQIFIVFILGISIINLILTISRGAYIAFGAMLILFFIIYFKNFFSFKRILIISFIVIIALFSVLGFLKFTGKEKNIDKFIKQATNISKGVAVKERYSTIDTAKMMIEEHPFIGFGPGSFGPYAAVSPYIQPNQGWLIVNNILLEIWAEEGLFGLISFLILGLIIIIRTIKAWQIANKTSNYYLKTILLGLFIAFISIFIQYQTFSILYILHIWFLIGLLIACQNMILNNSKPINASAKL